MKTTKDLFPNLIGQERAKRAITDWYNFENQPLLIYGSSGYGKTAYAESLGATHLQYRMRTAMTQHIPYRIRHYQYQQKQIYGACKCHLSKSLVQ